eukprot:COSAG06_NODE_6969_length_2692_cov_2.853066_3_plen_196_part_00
MGRNQHLIRHHAQSTAAPAAGATTQAAEEAGATVEEAAAAGAEAASVVGAAGATTTATGDSAEVAQSSTRHSTWQRRTPAEAVGAKAAAEKPHATPVPKAMDPTPSPRRSPRQKPAPTPVAEAEVEVGVDAGVGVAAVAKNPPAATTLSKTSPPRGKGVTKRFSTGKGLSRLRVTPPLCCSVGSRMIHAQFEGCA